MGKSPVLVVMAAGMGSRYGGLKQMDPITPQGEVLLDFSVYDAIRAGFSKVVIIIKHEIEKDFDELVGKRLRKQCAIEYAFQEKTDLPDGFSVLPERIKPWGTGQAIWAARNAVKEPFAVINADDYYGADAFVVMHDFLANGVTLEDYAMVGYELGNTLTDHGTVARGVCEYENGYLTNITERTRIARRDGGAAFTEDGETWESLPLDTLVSMQLFGFHHSVMDHAGRLFEEFLRKPYDPMKGEFLLPSMLGELLKSKQIRIRMLKSNDRWFGVTYAEDKPKVMEEIRKLRENGTYPPVLWG